MEIFSLLTNPALCEQVLQRLGDVDGIEAGYMDEMVDLMRDITTTTQREILRDLYQVWEGLDDTLLTTVLANINVERLYEDMLVVCLNQLNQKLAVQLVDHWEDHRLFKSLAGGSFNRYGMSTLIQTLVDHPR